MRNSMNWLLAAALCLVPAVSRADDAAAYQKAVSSVVSVFILQANGEGATGTGVLTEAGIITANHVIKPARSVFVIFPSRDSTGAVMGDPTQYHDASQLKLCVVAGTSAERDLALLRLVEPQKGQAIPLASASASPGDQVFTIGAPVGPAMWHFGSGTVRQAYSGSFRTTAGGEVRGRLVQTSVPARLGDSGSPVLSKQGELVGIISAMDTPTGNQISTAIDVSEVRSFLVETLKAEMQELRKKLKSAPRQDNRKEK
jgi:serine protease Do